MYQNYGQDHGNLPYGSPAHANANSNSYGNQASSYSSSSSESGGGMNYESSRIENAALSLLQHLDKDDLEHLHNNDSKLQDLIEDLPQVKSFQQERENLLATNKSIAEYNLSLQPRLEELKQIVAADYDKINALKTNLAQDKTRLDGYVGRRSLDTLHALLQTETAKSEEESENLATSFFDNGTGMEEFLNQYLPRRMEAHMRRIKSERMAELIRENQYSGYGSMGGGDPNTTQPATQPSYGSTPPYPRTLGTGGAPYPTSAAFQMPQPSSYHH